MAFDRGGHMAANGAEMSANGQSVADTPSEGGGQMADTTSDSVRLPAGDLAPLVDTLREVLHRYEGAITRNAYLELQVQETKALAADNRTLQERASAAEEAHRIAEQTAAAEAEARRRADEEKRQAEARANEEHEARRKAEEEAEGLRRRVSATEGALESERSKGFWARLRGR